VAAPVHHRVAGLGDPDRQDRARRGSRGCGGQGTEEETGWRPGPLRPLLRVEPSPGLSDSAHSIYRADKAERIGSPEDDFESDGVSWVPLASVPSLVGRGDITSGTTLAALLYVITSEH
jgi:hypothetical protein